MTTQTLRARTNYLSFPFRMSRQGAAQSERQAHIREQITQLLFTEPGERVFLPEFGIGLARVLFMPMTDALWQQIEVTLGAGLAEVLRGEILPDSIIVRAAPAPDDGATLRITISYTLAALNLSETLSFDITDGVLPLPRYTEAL
ncbi:GPW/gp25 family protein [Falsihalocynthiibacter arcticus]|uniref:IraD/Gp25-like domain-containing protein n=1 Tax=Falsihalocynthiibacter arcticus TaxID=1579316 RepID=A0A126V0Q8_9RHOB|nr:GPW/gp25 family protein [Falsihalocynthiibacter arcticus]AML51921.1 hypothetical protein RC74_12170 [Falsihalocynthiibacter arcticus]